MLLRITNAIVLLSLVALLGGCYSETPVRMRVLDADDAKPISGAKVGVGYLVYLNPFPPNPHEGVTDEAGRVTLPVASNAPPCVVDVSAPGYSPKRLKIPAEYLRPPALSQSPAELRIELKTQP